MLVRFVSAAPQWELPLLLLLSLLLLPLLLPLIFLLLPLLPFAFLNIALGIYQGTRNQHLSPHTY